MIEYSVFELRKGVYIVIKNNGVDETFVYQGNLSDCESYIKLKQGGYM